MLFRRLHVVDIEVADAVVTDLLFLDEPFERLEGLFYRIRSLPVEEIEVDIVGAEAPQASLGSRHRSLAGRVLRQHLRDNEHSVTASLDGFGDDFLGAAIGVHLRGVHHVHAEVETQAEGRNLLLPPRSILPHGPGAEAERGHLDPAPRPDLADRRELRGG